MSELTAAGVLDEDIEADLVAVDSGGILHAYPFSGMVNGMSAFGARTQVGTGGKPQSGGMPGAGTTCTHGLGLHTSRSQPGRPSLWAGCR